MCISNIMQELKNSRDMVVEVDLVRHMIINSLRSYKAKYSKEYGEMVICCDHRGKTWRHKKFPHYKATRIKNKDDSSIDWEAITKCIDIVRDEVDEFLPYKVVSAVDGEADDVIAALSEWSQTNYVEKSMFGEDPKPVLILSRDEDFIQLQKYPNIKQYSPISRQWIVPTKDARTDLIEKVIAGDRGDGVPSVLCPDDFFVNKDKYGRASPVNEKVKTKFKDVGTLNEDEKARLERNKELIDFTYIPDDVKQSAIDSYTNQPTKTKKNLLNYFMKNRMRQMITVMDEF